MTPSAELLPITQPPTKCAVNGAFTKSPICPPAIPPYRWAILRAVSFAAGMYVAFGRSESFSEVNRQPKIPRLLRTFIAESTSCITRAITVRSLHLFTLRIVAINPGLRIRAFNHCLRRSLTWKPSVIAV